MNLLEGRWSQVWHSNKFSGQEVKNCRKKTGFYNWNCKKKAQTWNYCALPMQMTNSVSAFLTLETVPILSAITHTGLRA